MLEVELKAHVKDSYVGEIRSRLGEYDENYEKKRDTYYVRPDGTMFRIRDYNGKLVLTEKKTAIKDGVECNVEDEREVYPAETDKLTEGCKVLFQKYKEGWEYFMPLKGLDGLHIELLNVKSLGWFCEMEILLPENESYNVEYAACALHSMLKILGINEPDIEPRKYKEMLGY